MKNRVQPQLGLALPVLNVRYSNTSYREAGECQWCPTGVVCSVEGMVNPCSKDDLPSPYEPVVSVNDIPMLE